jgi:hypothetical protein
MRSRSLSIVHLLVAGSLFACASNAQAALITLLDQNSGANFILEQQYGQVTWYVDGVNQLSKQWFWYRAGDMSHEASIDSLELTGFALTDTNPFTDENDDTLALLYADAAHTFNIELGLRLRGGTAGSGTADLAEQISIRNLTANPLEFHFFQYVDFNLDENPEGDLVNFPANNTVTQYKPGGSRVTETVITPSSSHRETRLVPITLDSLNDSLPTTLDGTNSSGPGNVAWAFEWDVVIAPGGEFQISKDKQIVPEPATLSLLALSALPLIRRRRK